MYQIHYFPSNANAAPNMVLEELGQKYDLVFVDRAKNAKKSKEYLKINPNGRIPALVDGDLVLFEAAAPRPRPMGRMSFRCASSVRSVPQLPSLTSAMASASMSRSTSTASTLDCAGYRHDQPWWLHLLRSQGPVA